MAADRCQQPVQWDCTTRPSAPHRQWMPAAGSPQQAQQSGRTRSVAVRYRLPNRHRLRPPTSGSSARRPAGPPFGARSLAAGGHFATGRSGPRRHEHQQTDASSLGIGIAARGTSPSASDCQWMSAASPARRCATHAAGRAQPLAGSETEAPVRHVSSRSPRARRTQAPSNAAACQSQAHIRHRLPLPSGRKPASAPAQAGHLACGRSNPWRPRRPVPQDDSVRHCTAAGKRGIPGVAAIGCCLGCDAPGMFMSA